MRKSVLTLRASDYIKIMNRIKKTVLAIMSASILLFMLSGCMGQPSTTDMSGVWIERNENTPIHLELRADGSYSKYQVFGDAKTMMDEGRWQIKKNNIIFHTTLGLNGSISDVGLTMHYAIGKSDTTTLLSIKSNGDVYFEGVKAPCEGNK